MESRVPRSPHDPDEGVWLARTLTVLPALVELLPQGQRYVVIGYFYDQRSIDDLAHGLGCPPILVRSLLQTALRTVRQILCE